MRVEEFPVRSPPASGTLFAEGKRQAEKEG